MHRKLLTLILGLALAALHLSGGISAPDVSTSAGAQANYDWPQLQRDPQRTGYTPDEVRPPYVYLWKWNEVPFANRTQPVVAGGRLFIGGLDGVMYARDAYTGGPLWTFATSGPIRHSAAVYEDRVLFGSHDGYIYSLNVVQGGLAWRFRTGAGIATAPVVANDTVYIGSADGNFYALNTNNGALRWSRDVGAPILTSAALSVDGGTVFFGAEDITAYALNTSDGSLQWSTELQGQSLGDRWPVVVGNSVVYRSQPLPFFHDLLHDGDDGMDEAGSVHSDWATDWNRVRPHIIDLLTENPDNQTFFVLDADTGALRGPAPVLYTYGGGDPPGPPVVRGDEIYTLFRARHGIQHDAGSVHVATRYDSALGQMDLNSLNVVNLTTAPGERWHLHYRATSDEPAVLSMGGSLLFVDNKYRLGGIDVDTGELIEVANVADYWPECGDWSVNCVGKSGPMPFFSSYPFPGPRVGEGRSAGHRPVVIANGIIYWRVVQAGLAAIGHSTNPRSTPYVWASQEASGAESDVLEPPASNALVQSSQSLSSYVWQEPIRPVPFPDSDLVELLEEEVQAVIEAGHMAPYFIERGFTTPQGIPGDSSDSGIVRFGPSGNVYWFDPGELVYTLSIAYPYLSSGLQNQLWAYLQNEINLYSPLERLPWPADWLTGGARREPYEVTVGVSVWPPPSPPLSTLYALWAYADATGDWGYMADHWSQIRALFNDKKDEVDSYAAISGAIGYARIADHLGHTAQAQEGEDVAVAAMLAGQDFSTFLGTANHRYPDPRNSPTGLRSPVFFGLVPEVGRYLRDTNGSEVAAYLAEMTDYYDGQYLWYLTRLGLQRERGETSFHGPELAWSVFLAKAFTEDITSIELQRYLDRPWGIGDMYYLQKLVAAIEADAQPHSIISSKQVSDHTPDPGDTVFYTITLSVSGGPLTETLYLTDDLDSGLSYVADSGSASVGNIQYSGGSILWNGALSVTSMARLAYEATVVNTTQPLAIVNEAIIDAGEHGVFSCSTTILVNGISFRLPLVLRGWSY
jgi:uncharacterized repeat protein (TIGR01451 family)